MTAVYESARDYGQRQVDMPSGPVQVACGGGGGGKAMPAGRKDDSGKLDMTLFDDMPHALEAVCEVMQWAITKKQPKPYIRGSWLGVEPDRYRAAILRHMSASSKQAALRVETASNAPRFERDDETSLLHLAHIACSALFALELTLREMKKA